MKLITRALVLFGLLTTIQCGSSTAPTSNTTMTFVLSAATVPPGLTTQGTVSLNAPPSGSVSIALSSSNAAVATVPGGSAVTGTATLTAAAPPGGAVVALSSAGPVIMPTSLTVNAGETSATFSISTRLGGGGASATIAHSSDLQSPAYHS